MLQSQYYYHQLDKNKQQVYHLLYEGVRSVSSGFSIPRVSHAELSELYSFVRMDHPELFFAPTFTFRYYPEAASMEIFPDYLFKGKQLEAQKQAIDARVTRILRPALSLTPDLQEQFIHDFLCKNVRYDKLKKAYSHEVYGPLSQGVGVCEGIAKTCKLLCDRLSLPCIIVLCPNNPEKGIRYRHMWNLISLNGHEYHLDCTFDLSLTGDCPIRYDYYNLNDTQIFVDHEPSLYRLPACTDGKHSWYSMNRLAFTTKDELCQRLSQHAKKKKPITFQWKGSVVTQDVLLELSEWIVSAAKSAGIAAEIGVNKPQGVFRVVFTDHSSLQLDNLTAFESEE